MFCEQEPLAMIKTTMVLTVMVLLSVVNASAVDDAQQSVTDSFFGLGKSLADSGVEIGLGVTSIYQQNVRRGLSTHRRAGRHSGSYDLEMTADLESFLSRWQKKAAPLAAHSSER